MMEPYEVFKGLPTVLRPCGLSEGSVASVSGLQSGDGSSLNVCHAYNLKQVFKIIISKRLLKKQSFK